MKKILTLMIAAALMIGFTACEKDDSGKNGGKETNALHVGDKTYKIGASCCYCYEYGEYSYYSLWFANKKTWNNDGHWPEDDAIYANGFEINIYDLYVTSATPGQITTGKYTYSEESGNFTHTGESDYCFYDENGDSDGYIEFGQFYVEESNLVIEVKHISGNIYEIKFTGGVDESGNPVSGYYKGKVDTFGMPEN